MPTGFSRPLEFVHLFAEIHLVERTSGPRPGEGCSMSQPRSSERGSPRLRVGLERGRQAEVNGEMLGLTYTTTPVSAE